jgi:sugar phosphate isomerase/epimerase
MTTRNRPTRRRFLQQTLTTGAAALLAPSLAAAPAAAQPAPKAAWQIGIYTRPWAKWDYRTALDAIAEAGFKYAGLMTAKSKSGVVISAESSLDEARAVGEEARKRGLAIGSVYGGGYPVRKDSLEPGIKGLRKVIDNVVAAGGTSLLLGGTGDPKLQEPYYKIVAECCDYAAEKGIWMSVKPHGGLNATGPQCRKCIEAVGQKSFRLWYDPGNIFFYSDGKLDPVEDAATVDGLVGGMSVKDFKQPKQVDVTPGTGLVDFPKVMARLRQGGFTGGPLVIECLAPGDLKPTLAEAKKARQFVEQLVRG